MNHNDLQKAANLDDEVVIALRKCGHFLHHSAAKISNKDLTADLTEEEKNTLAVLLQKCLDGWRAQQMNQDN